MKQFESDQNIKCPISLSTKTTGAISVYMLKLIVFFILPLNNVIYDTIVHHHHQADISLTAVFVVLLPLYKQKPTSHVFIVSQAHMEIKEDESKCEASGGSLYLHLSPHQDDHMRMSLIFPLLLLFITSVSCSGSRDQLSSTLHWNADNLTFTAAP